MKWNNEFRSFATQRKRNSLDCSDDPNNGELRGNIIGNDVYVWDSYLATHWEIAQFLGYGLIDCLGIEIGGNDVIYLANAMLHRNRDPNADIEMIRALPSFRGMRVSQRPWRN